MSKTGAYIALMRPVNMVICALSVASAGILAGKPFDRIVVFINALVRGDKLSMTAHVPLAALSAALILAAGNVLNDVFDRETDRINSPERPVASGIVTQKHALIFSAILFIAGILLASAVGPLALSVAVMASIVLIVYDSRLKSVPLAGNASVAFLGGMAFVYGGIAGDCLKESLLPAFLAAFLHFGREIIKDAEDIEGDRAAGITTAATIWGPVVSCRIAAAALLILIPLTALPAALGRFGSEYLVILFLGVWPQILFSISLAFGKPSRRHLSISSRLLKFAMPAGILAVLVGYQGW